MIFIPKRNQIDESIFGKTIGSFYVTDIFYIDRVSTKNCRTFIKCICNKCYKEQFVDKRKLLHCNNVSCDCEKEIPLRDRPLYHLYYGIKERCYNVNNKKYNIYGGKGVVMCDEWKNGYKIFEEWALSNGYKEGLTIDRIDSNGNYCPDNCRWITLSENSKRANYGRQKNFSKLGCIVGIYNKKAIIFDNITKFARENNLTTAGIRNCVMSIGFKNHRYKNWMFYTLSDVNKEIMESVTTIENITTKKYSSE